MSDDNNDDDLSPTIAKIPQDLALIKVENETMMSAAAARPRDLTKIAQGIVAQIREFPGFAAVVLYARPVGKDDEGQQKIATGLSIRAAEAIAEAYGFNRVWSEVKLLDDGNAQVSASFTDFQRCRVTSASVTVSRTFRKKTGGVQTHSQERFLDVVCKAAQSKLIRDVIVRSVPPSLKTTMELAVRTSVKISDKVAQAIVAYFGELQVTQAELEAFLGAPRAMWSDVHRQRLQEIKNAVESDEDGVAETTIEDLFGKRPEKPSAKNGSAPVPAAASTTQSAVTSALSNPVEAKADVKAEPLSAAEMEAEDRKIAEREATKAKR